MSEPKPFEFKRSQLLGGSLVAAIALVSLIPTGATIEYLEQRVRLLTPLTIAVGFYIAWRRSLAAEKQAENASRQVEVATQQAEIATQQAEIASRQVLLLERGQVTQRFTEAIKQLGDKDSIAICLGGIYALEQIAKDAPGAYHWTVCEVLCSFLRQRTSTEHADQQLERESKAPPMAIDSQAALTVLGRFRERDGDNEHGRLDLTRTNLTRADLSGANLSGVELKGADLSGADLSGADLSGADLARVKLRGADLSNAKIAEDFLSVAGFSGADLSGVKLRGLKFRGADLSNMDLSNADLSGADLSQANLDGTVLDGTILDGTILDGTNPGPTSLMSARNLTQDQIDSTNSEGIVLPDYLINL